MPKNQLLLTLFLLLSAQFGFSQTTFSEVSLGAGIDHLYLSLMKMGGGMAWFDHDGDGDEDLVLSGGVAPNRLFRNEGNGQFTDISVAAGLNVLAGRETMGVATADINNDGYREILFTATMNHPSYLMLNNGNGTYTDITMSSGIGADSSWGTSATWGDINLDGLIDLYVGNYVYDIQVLYDTSGNPNGFDPTCLPNFLYINNGDLTFTESSLSYGVADSGCALAATFTTSRVSPHPLPDLLIANDHGAWNIPNRLYLNNHPSPTATEGSAACNLDEPMYGMGIAVGDYDHDLDLDYYITDIGPNKLFQNNGLGQFDQVAAASGVEHGTLNGANTTGWGTAFLDFDNDSWQDIFVANGHISVLPFIANNLRDPDKMFKNLGNGQFADVTTAVSLGDSGLSRGMAYADYDQDGDLDLAVASIHWDSSSGVHTLLYENGLGNGKHWLALKLEGTISNRDAFGAQVLIHADANNAWLEEVSGGNSHMSQNSSILHFGLDNLSSVLSVEVRWPSGGVELFSNLPVDTLLHIVEDSSNFIQALPGYQNSLLHMVAVPNPSQAEVALHVNSSIAASATLTVHDLQGRCILQFNNLQLAAGENELVLDQKDLPQGMYIARLLSEEGHAEALMIRR